MDTMKADKSEFLDNINLKAMAIAPETKPVHMTLT
jgi:hypothetical protein